METRGGGGRRAGYALPRGEGSAPPATAVLAVLDARLGMRVPSGMNLGPLVSAVCETERCRPEQVPGALARMSREELLGYSDLVLCHETFFFRHARHFEVLTELAGALIAASERASGSRVLRVLSAGCATGEEPYSLAIWARRTLAAHRGWSAQVLGVDRSARALEVAHRAQYGRWSLRSNAELHADGALLPIAGVEDQVEVAPAIRDAVTFLRRDLTEAAEVAALGPQAFVLCRNVFMYLSTRAAQAALDALAALLIAGGALICEAHDLVGLTVPAVLEERKYGRDFVLYRPAAPARSSTSRAPIALPRAQSANPAVVAAPAPVPVPAPAPSPRATDADPIEPPRATPDGAEQHWQAALGAELRNDYQQAESELRMAVAIDPSCRAPRLQLGILLLRSNRRAEGLAILRAVRVRLAEPPPHEDLLRLCDHVLRLERQRA